MTYTHRHIHICIHTRTRTSHVHINPDCHLYPGTSRPHKNLIKARIYMGRN